MFRRKRGPAMEIRVERLGSTFKKQEEPACRACGYDAEWIVKLESLSGMFCERCFIDAWLDVMNFSIKVPDSL